MSEVIKLTDEKLTELVTEELKKIVGEADFNAFKKGLRRIDETGINRILSHGEHGYIIISANRSEIYSDIKDNSLLEEYLAWCAAYGKNVVDKQTMDSWLRNRNKKADSELLGQLKASKYAYTPVYGGYHGKDDVTDSFEPSYIVYCHGKKNSEDYLDFDELYDFALDLAKRYKQDSVYVNKPGEAPIYVDGNGNKVNSRESKNYKINRYTEEYFTTKNRKKRTTSDYPDKNGEGRLETPPQRFTADIQFENYYRKAGPSCYGDRIKRSQSGEVFIGE